MHPFPWLLPWDSRIHWGTTSALLITAMMTLVCVHEVSRILKKLEEKRDCRDFMEAFTIVHRSKPGMYWVQRQQRTSGMESTSVRRHRNNISHFKKRFNGGSYSSI